MVGRRKRCHEFCRRGLPATGARRWRERSLEGWRWAAATSLVLALAGCEGLGRGVAQAVLEGTQGDGEDTRSCEIEGRAFAGVEPYLARQDRLPPFGEDGTGERPEVKLLYVHGI